MKQSCGEVDKCETDFLSQKISQVAQKQKLNGRKKLIGDVKIEVSWIDKNKWTDRQVQQTYLTTLQDTQNDRWTNMSFQEAIVKPETSEVYGKT